MKPLILSATNNKYDNFEKTRLRKNLKGSLELNDFSYCTSFIESGYKVIHFIDLDDYRKYRSEIPEGIKKIISVFYVEEDHGGKIYSEGFDGKYAISKNDVDLLNEFDLILVPSETAKTILLSFGVLPKIKVESPGVNVTKFSISNTYVRNIAFRYLKCPDDVPFIISVIDYRDVEAAKRVRELAFSFPKIRFIVIYHCVHVSREMKKAMKKPPANLTFSLPVEDDVYTSMAFNAKAYLFLSSNYGCVLQCYEAMASETQIIALKSSVFNDIVIDKENGYVYNDFASLKEGLDEFLNNKIPSTINKAKEFAIKNSLKKIGVDLDNIYNRI